MCYLTVRPERLCNAAERRHLVWILARWQEDREAFNRAVMVSVVRIQQRANFGSGEPLERLTAAQKAEAGRLKESGLAKAIRLETEPDSTLAKKIRSLAARGYVSREDFGSWPPDIVTDAFKDFAPRPQKRC